MIIGAGNVGMPIIRYLSERGHLLTVIEVDEKRCRLICNDSDAAIFFGNGADLEIWKNTEASTIDVLMTLTNNDETNVRACEIAKRQYGIPFVIARVHEPENIDNVKKAGADIAICPAQEVRRLFINALESLTVETLYEHATTNFRIVKVTIPLNGSIIGKTPDFLGISENCRIINIFRNGNLQFPTKSFIFKGGDKVILSGSEETVKEIVERLRKVEIT